MDSLPYGGDYTYYGETEIGDFASGKDIIEFEVADLHFVGAAARTELEVGDVGYTTDPFGGICVTVRMEDATDDRLSIIGVYLPDYTGPLTAADFGLE